MQLNMLNENSVINGKILNKYAITYMQNKNGINQFCKTWSQFVSCQLDLN